MEPARRRFSRDPTLIRREKNRATSRNPGAAIADANEAPVEKE
jgi:hypothetical protein